jgi:hypothetical protein
VTPARDATGNVLRDVGVELVSLSDREVRESGEPAYVICQEHPSLATI